MLAQYFEGQISDTAEADPITAVQFDQTGEFLATGDRGGNVTLYKGEEVASEEEETFGKRKTRYKVFAGFKSHESEFDYLKSLEIEEKINQIKWCPPINNAQFLLSTNDKTIKLWKVRERKVREMAVMEHPSNGDVIRVPKLPAASRSVVATTERRVFSNAHAYHINSMSLNSDGETFLSADDLRLNWWNLEINDRSFNIVDMKPTNMEELTEVITSAQFHPHHCHILMYSTSRGTIKLGDTRQQALCDHSAKVVEDTTTAGQSNFFAEIISSISDVQFAQDGRHIIARDYLTVKVWDINMESRPIQTINVHDHLRGRLCELYESECIFDKFEVAVSPDGRSFATGSYSNTFNVHNRAPKSDMTIELSNSTDAGDMSGPRRALPQAKSPSRRRNQHEALDFSKKVLHVHWHPTKNMIAVAGMNNLYLYDL